MYNRHLPRFTNTIVIYFGASIAKGRAQNTTVGTRYYIENKTSSAQSHTEVLLIVLIGQEYKYSSTGVLATMILLSVKTASCVFCTWKVYPNGDHHVRGAFVCSVKSALSLVSLVVENALVWAAGISQGSPRRLGRCGTHHEPYECGLQRKVRAAAQVHDPTPGSPPRRVLPIFCRSRTINCQQHRVCTSLFEQKIEAKLFLLTSSTSTTVGALIAGRAGREEVVDASIGWY